MFPFSIFCPTSVLLYILPAIILVILSGYVIKTYRRDPRLVQFAETIPGPPETSIFGSFKDLLHGEDSIKKMANYLDKYGHVYKLWFGRHLLVGLSNVEDLNTVFMSSKMLAKPEMFHPFHDFWGDGLFTGPVNIWKHNRKKLVPAFGSNRFNRYTIDINNKIKNSIKLVEKHVNGPEFDIKEYTPILSFDVVLKLLFNVEISYDHEVVKEFHRSILKASLISFQRMCLPWFHMKFLSYSYFAKRAKEAFEGTRKLTKMILKEKISQIHDEIRLHKENPDKLPIEEIPPKSFLTYAFELLDDGYNESVVHDQVMTAISAGAETTSTELAFFFLAIAMYPDIQTKLYDEIYEVFGDSDRDADQEDVKRLSYLEQVLKETLRRFPIIPLIFREVSEDCKIGDRIFPAGTALLIPIAAVHMDPKYYPNPWEFNPQNFSPEVAAYRPKHAFIPFSGGARNCIGQNLGLLQMKLTATAYLRKYSFYTTMTMEDIKLNRSFTINSESGHNVSIKYRIRKPSYILSNN